MQKALYSAYKKEKIENLKEFDEPPELRRSKSALWQKLNPTMVKHQIEIFAIFKSNNFI